MRNHLSVARALRRMTTGNGAYCPPNMKERYVERALSNRAHLCRGRMPLTIMLTRAGGWRPRDVYYLDAAFASSPKEPISPMCKTKGSADDLA
jgi:hypothetical protein